VPCRRQLTPERKTLRPTDPGPCGTGSQRRTTHWLRCNMEVQHTAR
jgi:hypothetical protein